MNQWELGVKVEDDPEWDGPDLLLEMAAKAKPVRSKRDIAEITRLQGILTDIIEGSRDHTGYCNWCDARPNQEHTEECPAYLAYIGVNG
jgi:hypothetical protein